MLYTLEENNTVKRDKKKYGKSRKNVDTNGTGETH
jgi:hypothetical protein